MSRRLRHPRAEICQICDFLLPRQLPRSQYLCSPGALNSLRPFSTTRESYAQAKAAKRINPIALVGGPRIGKGAAQAGPPKHLSEEELKVVWREVKTTCDALLALKRLPTEEETIKALGKCNSLAELLVLDRPSDTIDSVDGAALALLDVGESKPQKTAAHKLPSSVRETMDDLSRLAYSIVTHPPVFISPNVLRLYTILQSNLGKPHTFPEVFLLYCNKPLPAEGTPIKYSEQNPNKTSNAIEAPIANMALQTAIEAKELVVAMDIIDTTFTTTAFQRAKFVRKCLLPATAVAAAPLAAYALASQLAALQDTMEPATATNVAFAGIMAYGLFTGTIGVVALTTANDQMDRVTWAPGIPLYQRYMREEERAALDKVAVAWGFRETWRRGEEEGEDWDALREWIGMKGMILDRVELMEGME